MNSYTSYGKIYNLGHRAIRNLFSDKVVIEEKVDGSQFSFGKFKNEEGEVVIRARSRGKHIGIDAPDKMFELAIEPVKGMYADLTEWWKMRLAEAQFTDHEEDPAKETVGVGGEG